MRRAADEDADLWARAEAALDSTPPEPAGRQAARERYDRLVAGVCVVLTGTAVALGFLLPLLESSGDRSTWRLVSGPTVVVLALLLMTVAPLARPSGSTRELTRPLEWLSGAQRQELKRQVRGGSAVPTRRPLARLEARAMIDGRGDGLPLFGLGVAHVGFWIWDASRTILAAITVAAMAVLWFVQSRDARLARRFLEQHPDPAS
jgi:hypothetical protein